MTELLQTGINTLKGNPDQHWHILTEKRDTYLVEGVLLASSGAGSGSSGVSSWGLHCIVCG